MTEREKMIEVIKQAFKEEGRMSKEQAKRVFSGEIKKASQELPPIDEFIADALIAAGFGDVSELKNHRLVAEYSLIPGDGNSYVLPDIPLRITQLYSGEEVEKIVKERDEYKHRAEVAERALKSEAMCHVLKYFPNELSGLESCMQEVYEAWIYQAEKELAEEGKDENY